MPCFPAQLQAPAKSFLRPSTWMPGAKNYHVCTQRWRIDSDPDECINELMNAVEKLNETEHPHEYYVNKVISFSTGALPAWLPFGFICDMLLCWCPFSDSGMNEFRCKLLREALPFEVTVLYERESDQLLPKHDESDTVEYSRPNNLETKKIV